MSIRFIQLGFPKLVGSGSATTHLRECFCHWTFSLNIALNLLPSDFFVSCLDSVLGYSTGESRALQLIAFVVCGAVDQPLGRRLALISNES